MRSRSIELLNVPENAELEALRPDPDAHASDRERMQQITVEFPALAAPDVQGTRTPHPT